MDSRILLRNLTSGENNIGDLPAKTIRVENTPRKVPFKDATNQSSMFKTPAGKFKNEINKQKEIQSTMKAPKLQIETPLDFDYDFDFPPRIHNGCYCSGSEKRMTEIELINDRLANPDYMELLNVDTFHLNSFDSSLEYDDLKLNIDEIKRLSTPSLITAKNVYSMRCDDADDASNKENESDNKAFNWSMDFDSSLDFEVPPLESDNEDSFIKDW